MSNIYTQLLKLAYIGLCEPYSYSFLVQKSFNMESQGSKVSPKNHSNYGDEKLHNLILSDIVVVNFVFWALIFPWLVLLVDGDF
jgi:hypothetical protein